MTLKSVGEHNKQVFENKRPKEVGTGVQCPHCGDEMHYFSGDGLLLTNPPQRNVHCNTCKYETKLYV